MAQGFHMFQDEIDITPGTIGSWVNVDVSANVPSGASGAVLHFIGQASSSLGGDVRANGSTDDHYAQGGLQAEVHRYNFVKLDANRIFQAKIGDTNVKLYLVGYTDGNVQFQTNVTDVTSATAGAWTDKDLSAYIPSGASAVIIKFINTLALYNYQCAARKPTSTDAFQNEMYVNTYSPASIICGVSGTRHIELYMQDITNTKAYLVGYLLPLTSMFTNAIDKTPITTAAWVDVDVSSIVSTDAVAVILNLTRPASGTFANGVRAKDSTQNLNKSLTPNTYTGAVVKLNAAKLFQSYVADTNSHVRVVGYCYPERMSPPHANLIGLSASPVMDNAKFEMATLG